MAPAARRVTEGVICQACDRRRGSTTGGCDCGQIGPLVTGRCVACRLRERVANLAADADRDAALSLAPFLAALASTPNAASMLRWTCTPGFDVCRQLLAGELPVSHSGLDQAAAGWPRAADFLRAKLIDSGVLPERDAQAASFAAWHQDATQRISAGVDRAQVRAYATWEVSAQLAARARRGEIRYASQKYARSLVSEAINLICWLHNQNLGLSHLRQDHVDEWVTAGRSQRRRIRIFLAWLARAGVTGQLHVSWEQHPATRAALDDRERLELLADLLYNDSLAATDRLAGCLLLLYAQPLTRIVTLRTSDVSITAQGTTEITLGRGTVQFPEPLGSAIRVFLDHRDELRGPADAWLLPGRLAGRHLSADALGQRLQRLGLKRAVNGRHAAMLALAARLPPLILAQRIGINQARAANWSRLAGVTYADYVRIRHADDHPARSGSSAPDRTSIQR